MLLRSSPQGVQKVAAAGKTPQTPSSFGAPPKPKSESAAGPAKRTHGGVLSFKSVQEPAPLTAKGTPARPKVWAAPSRDEEEEAEEWEEQQFEGSAPMPLRHVAKAAVLPGRVPKSPPLGRVPKAPAHRTLRPAKQAEAEPEKDEWTRSFERRWAEALGEELEENVAGEGDGVDAS